MAIRKLQLSWNASSGYLRSMSGLAPRLKRQEPLTLVVHVDALITDAADLSLALREAGNFDGEPLLTITGWTWTLSSLTWTVDVVIDSEVIDALLCVNDDSGDDITESPVVLDVRAFASNGTTELAASSTLKLTLENNPGRDGAEYIQTGGP
jgi:hypothetical protein